MALTAEQKIRNQLAENAWRFQHEGAQVIRWITGGSVQPDAYVTFDEPQDGKVVARCPSCRIPLGQFDADYSGAASEQIGAIRDVSAQHRCSFSAR